MFSRKVISNTHRVGLLRKMINQKGLVRIIEAHNGLSALIAMEASAKRGKYSVKFDGIWESSLTDSASKGLPDIEIVGFDSRFDTINQILEVTSKPVIVDVDTGGDLNHFGHLVRKLERAGVSMVVVEDKIHPKRNSFATSQQRLEDPEIFSRKIAKGVSVRGDRDFMIIARIESLIVNNGMEDAIKRAHMFLKAGADGIMIHSKSESPEEILEFSIRYHKLPKEVIRNKILVCIPTTYNTIKASELAENGFHVVIYANHLLRAAYKAMLEVCEEILKNDRTSEVERKCIQIDQLFKIVGMSEIIADDNRENSKIKGNSQDK